MPPRERVALSNGDHELLHFIEELEKAGIDHSKLSDLPSLETVGKQIRHELHMVEEAEDGLTIQRATPIGMGHLGQAQGALIGGSLYAGPAPD